VLFSYPFTIGAQPRQSEPLQVRKAWARKLTIFSALAGFAFVGAAFGAVLILRKVRQEFAEQSLHNLAELLTAEVESKKKLDG
jgi:hypothetical protein